MMKLGKLQKIIILLIAFLFITFSTSVQADQSWVDLCKKFEKATSGQIEWSSITDDEINRMVNYKNEDRNGDDAKYSSFEYYESYIEQAKKQQNSRQSTASDTKTQPNLKDSLSGGATFGSSSTSGTSNGSSTASGTTSNGNSSTNVNTANEDWDTFWSRFMKETTANGKKSNLSDADLERMIAGPTQDERYGRSYAYNCGRS